MVYILCIIPARSGSKGIPDKNIRLYKNKPLLQHSIEQAKQSKYFSNMRLIVSTDSQKYLNIAEKLGVKVPFLRPDNISDDLSTDYQYIKHAVDWLKINEKYVPNIILQLRPTSPERTVEDIDNAIDIFIKYRHKYDSLRSVIKIDKTPYKMYHISNDILTPIFHKYNKMNEPYNLARQTFPTTYLHNGYIDILNTEILLNKTISGSRILPYVMKDSCNLDIDNEADLLSKRQFFSIFSFKLSSWTWRILHCLLYIFNTFYQFY